MDDLDEAVITLTSLMHQSMEMEFTVVVLCDVQEVSVVMDVITRRKQYNLSRIVTSMWRTPQNLMVKNETKFLL